MDQDVSLPRGTVTFLFTDIEGSTRLWDAHPEMMRTVMVRHDEIIDQIVLANKGVVHRPRGEGDSRFVVFPRAEDGAAAAAAIQMRFAAEPWPTPVPVSVRIGLHTGIADLRDGDYYGTAVNRAARIRGIGHGGQILLSQVTADLVRSALPAGASLVDLGEHRLRDLTRPEIVYQLVAAGARREFPPLTSLSELVNNLPAQPTALIGRDAELVELSELLAERRLVTVLAAGGTGKTRLAIQVAAEAAPAFADGVFLVPLAPIAHATALPGAIAEAIGLQLAGDDDVGEQVVAYVRGKRKLLLVLDNVEHLLAGATFVGRMLEASPELRILVTSRERLDITGETVFGLTGLDWRWEDDAGFGASSGVALFLDAARRRTPDLAFRDEDHEPLAAILGATDGMPLGILLAAGWTDVLSIPEIAEEIAQSVDFLETEMSDVPERHRSIRAVFDYTWNRLGASDRELFAKLSVFRGGFTRKAAAAVAGATVRDLSRLAGKSLIAADPESGRFSVHELLRQFGSDRLDAMGSAAATTSAYVDHLGDLTGDLADMIRSGGQREALVVMEADLENIRAAWWLALDGDVRRLSRDYLLCLYFWHEVRGGFRSATQLFADTSSRLDMLDGDHAALMAALCRFSHAWFIGLLGDPAAAIAEADGAQPIVDRHGSADDVAFATHCRNISLLYTNAAERLVVDCEAALERMADEAHPWSHMLNYAWLAHGFAGSGRLTEAEEVADESLAEYRHLGELWVTIWIYEAKAIIARGRGDLAGARTHYEQVLAAARAIAHGRAIHYALNNLGSIAADQGDLEAAEQYHLEALSLSEDLGQIQEVLSILCDVARVRLSAGDLANAAVILSVILDSEFASQRVRFGPTPIEEVATELMTELQSVGSADLVEESTRDGRERGLDEVMRGLLAARAADRSLPD